MSIQEIEAAIAKLPSEQLRELSAWLEALLARSGDLSTNPKYMEGFGEPASTKRLTERKAVINAARQHWRLLFPGYSWLSSFTPTFDSSNFQTQRQERFHPVSKPHPFNLTQRQVLVAAVVVNLGGFHRSIARHLLRLG